MKRGQGFLPLTGQFFFILVNKTNKYSKLVISLLGFAQIVRSEFQTRVRFFFTQKRKKKKTGSVFETRVRVNIYIYIFLRFQYY
jgi:hypothetical protein